MSPYEVCRLHIPEEPSVQMLSLELTQVIKSPLLYQVMD